MSSTSSQSHSPVIPHCLALVKRELECVGRMLADELQSDVPIIDEMVSQGGAIGGKHFRPLLMLLTAKANGAVNPQHLTLATAIEMIHAATLVHDDILDGAVTRRHRRTINSRWGHHGAVLFGDFLFSHAFYLASTTGDAFACETIGRATNLVCEGELQQTDASGNYDISLDDYWEIIGKNTAALFACSTFLGAHYAGATTDVCNRWQQVGHDLGMAFQIIDDVLDVGGDDQHCGKTLGTDLESAKPTLPVLLALQQELPDGQIRWLDRLANSEVSPFEFREWLTRLGAIEAATAEAETFAARALDRIRRLPPVELVNDAFVELGDYLLNRTR